MTGHTKRSPIFEVLEPIVGTFAFFLVLVAAAYGVSLVGVNGGSIAVIRVQDTSVGINILGLLALLAGVAWIFAVIRGRFRELIVHRWAVALG